MGDISREWYEGVEEMKEEELLMDQEGAERSSHIEISRSVREGVCVRVSLCVCLCVCVCLFYPRSGGRRKGQGQ